MRNMMGDDREPQPQGLRFVRAVDYAELINLYHLAKCALSGQPCTKYDRMVWAAREWAKKHDYCTAGGAYKDLSTMLSGY